ncbi:MAG: type II toxin-antitoxin system Phd/YefM family antitoxin [Gemmatimonadota bacterium]
MAERTVSIAEARAKLPGLVKEAEGGTAVQITRWGAPVAVLVSATRFQQLAHGRPSFAVALDGFLERIDMTGMRLGKGELQGLRDREAGRQPPW